MLLKAAPAVAAQFSMTLEVDARNVMQGIQHVHLTLPVHAGPLALAYPEWIPGEHQPSGPITQLMNVNITGNGKALHWRRDPRNAFLFRITVPKSVRALDIHFDYFSPPQPFGGGFGKSPDTTPHLLILPFNQFVLYPADASADSIDIKAQIMIPSGWNFDDALKPEKVNGPEIDLPETSLSTLVDSPLLAGQYFRRIAVTGGAGATRLSMAADAPQDLAVKPSLIASLGRLVQQETALFGPGHYRRYVWLVALANNLDHDGLEHHESSDVREAEGLFTDPTYAIDWRLFPHEYMHSWNGKYRLPEGLVIRNYQQPMADDLLWVYEGLTRYYADLTLATRSGLTTAAQSRSYLAYIAAVMDRDRPGRDWRTLADTATAEPAYANAPLAWCQIASNCDPLFASNNDPL
jgi:predicted metalloprotease with PDZ domain